MSNHNSVVLDYSLMFKKEHSKGEGANTNNKKLGKEHFKNRIEKYEKTFRGDEKIEKRVFKDAINRQSHFKFRN